jgi:hypothetical protein
LLLNLCAPPEIYTAPREIVFFSANSRYELGLDWYREQFEGWEGEPLVGEASPAYLMWTQRPDEVAERIRSSLGAVKVVAILRDPVDRAASALLHHVQLGRVPPGTALLDFVRERAPEDDRLGIVSGGWYAASLRPYRDRFGDDLLVLLHDDLAVDPRRVYVRALEHVGADPGFVPGRLEQVRFSYREKLASADPDGAGAEAPLSQEERVALWEFFRDDVAELEAMLGRDLSAWDPSR